jgi:DNA repair protein RecO (recombination protein O)
MSIYKGRGVVIKEMLSGESNKNVILFLKGRGKTIVFARGAKKHNSKFLAGTQLFCYSDFLINHNGKIDVINQIDIITSFYKITSDYQSICYGNHMLEMCNKLLENNAECDDILLLLIKSLNQLTKKNINLKLVNTIFEIKFMQYSGYEISLCCKNCGKYEESYSHINHEGFVCNMCIDDEKGLIKISKNTSFAITYITVSKITEIFNFKVNEEVLQELMVVSDTIIKYYFNVKFVSKNNIFL